MHHLIICCWQILRLRPHCPAHEVCMNLQQETRLLLNADLAEVRSLFKSARSKTMAARKSHSKCVNGHIFADRLKPRSNDDVFARCRRIPRLGLKVKWRSANRDMRYIYDDGRRTLIPGHLPKKIKGSKISRHHADNGKKMFEILSSSILKKDQREIFP